jgi:inosine/xanthosine triphosphatase
MYSTVHGAINRAKAAFSEYFILHGENPTYSIGLEGGVAVTFDGEMECFAWIAVFDGVTLGTSRTASLFLPSVIRDIVIVEGLELGAADDRVFGTHNSKQSAGAVGLLTNGVIDRAAYYEPAVVLAFIPFHWKELYK